MFSRFYSTLAAGALAFALGSPDAMGAGPDQAAKVRQAVDAAMLPVIQQHGIPGLAVAVTIDGSRHFIDYGLASKDPKVSVTRETLFELGSISKTFTATLTTYAVIEGKLSLNDPVSKHMPELTGSAFDNVRVLDLGTHTAGGFPLQLPDSVKDQAQLIAYFRARKPQSATGTVRNYANPSVGLLGKITAKAMGDGFEALMERRLFRELGLRRTFINIPAAEMTSYAWGHNRDDKPVRVSPDLIASEAYGVKSNAVDMIRFVEVNMGVGSAPTKVASAVSATHTGYFRSGELVQGLIWEHYPWPVALEKIVAGNSPAIAANATPVTAIDSPMAPRRDVILNKTGSTNGFGAYVAFVPEEKIGIVMLANKYYPNAARVKAAHEVLSRLTQ